MVICCAFVAIFSRVFCGSDAPFTVVRYVLVLLCCVFVVAGCGFMVIGRVFLCDGDAFSPKFWGEIGGRGREAAPTTDDRRPKCYRR